jgi:hypothetical protein
LTTGILLCIQAIGVWLRQIALVFIFSLLNAFIMQQKFSFHKFMLCLAVAIGCHFSALAQSAAPVGGKAALSKEGKVALQKGQSLQYNNVLDLSALGAAEESATTARFAQKNTELVTFQMDPAKKVMYVQIELRAKPEWTIDDWNAYLAKL